MRPARSMARLSTSSTGSTPSNSRWPSSVIVTPTSTRSRPAFHVPAARSCELVGRAVRGVEAPADAAVGDPVADAREVLVLEAEAPAHGLAVGEVEHVGGGQAAAGEVDQLGDDAEHRVGLAQRAVGEADAQVGRAQLGGERRRTRRRRPRRRRTWPGSAARTPRCPGTSRSRRAAAACRPPRAGGGSRRAGPRPGARGRGRSGSGCCGRAGRAAVGRRGGPAAGSRAGSGRRARRPGCARAACRRRASTGWWWATCSCVPSTSCISRASWPQEASSRLSASAAVVSSARRTTGGRLADLLPQRGRGVEEEDVHLAPGGERAQDVEVAGRQPRQAEQRDALGEGGERGVGSQPLARGLEPLGGARLGEPRAQPPPQLRLPRGLGGHVDLAARPPAHHRRPVQRVAVEQLGEVADGREAARAAVGVVLGAEVDRRGCAATARRRHSPTTSSSGQTARCGDHGSVSGSTPDAVATASPTSRCGNGNSTFAQTPSERPGVAPRLADIRWVSQRSIPRVGTEMTSGANGSGSGSASSSPSASTRPSARSARWMWSIGHREVARQRTTLTSDSAEQRLQLPADGQAQPLDVLLAGVEDAHPETVERGDDEPDVELRGRRR